MLRRTQLASLFKTLPKQAPLQNRLLSLRATRILGQEQQESEDVVQRCEYPGASSAPFTKDLKFVDRTATAPVYRVLDSEGKVVNSSHVPELSNEQLLKMYNDMIQINVMDNILNNAQRQGRISFYMTNSGEEAAQIGSAAALSLEDMVFAQYREAGVLVYRGFTFDEFLNQCFGNIHDYGKGRQMPVHYGSKKLNFQTISSPLATQIPQAAGAGYALKLQKKDNVVMCYFGEGAASEGDFHSALNFAATLGSQTIFFCRNNGFAISTPVSEQYKGDGIVGRGFGYGINSIRVDGNDMFAVYNATREARALCIQNRAPVVIEAMTYRAGHHSTSDDSSRYRDSAEIEHWSKNKSPVTRLRLYLESKNLWNQEKEDAARSQARKAVVAALDRSEKADKPDYHALFEDVFDTPTWNLLEQKKQLEEHMAKYPEEYGMFMPKK